MPQSIPSGLTADHVVRALADLNAGAAHSFGEPTKFEVVHQGKRYAPKAVVGLACRYLIGRVLNHDEFSGGEAPGQANYVLRRLGFTVVRKGEDVETDDARKDWSEAEVTLVVADYFQMLEKELLVKPYSKAEHRAALRPLLAGRSDGSVEFKHQNISAVLVALNLPYIRGYKPRGNYQALLAAGVESYLAAHPGYLGALAAAPALSPERAPAASFADASELFDDPPERIAIPEPGTPWLTRRARRLDFAERDAADRRLGNMGEGFVIELERHRLRQAGRDDLAKKVRHSWCCCCSRATESSQILSTRPRKR
jgi:hypothetical protein